jgi:predicted acetyltransferase
MDVEYRSLREDEIDAVIDAQGLWFGEGISPRERERERSITDPDRYFVALDGDRIVAGTASVRFQLTLPGGVTTQCSGVTGVGTLPTHRRKGLATELMRRQLDDAREHEEPVSYLWASEAVIYQRFGFGLGAYACAFEIHRDGTGFVREVDTPGRMRLVNREEATKLIPDVYERVRPTRPGMVDRPGPWLDYRLPHPDDSGGKGSSPPFFAICETGEGVDGYVVYSIKDKWTHGGPELELEVDELIAATPDAYATLWRYVFDVDLIRKIEGWKRPLDEPLLHLLLEPRALRFQVRDGTWVRLVDVAAALEARRYSHEGRLVLEVRDEFAQWNDGVYELEAGPEGASCRQSGAAPDLSMRVEDLAATYLGTVSFRQLAAAGRVTERNSGALVSADAMFSSAVAPWCPWIF